MPRRKSPITTAVDVTKGSAAIGRMVAGQVARTAITAAGSAVGAVTERAGRRKVAHTSGPVTTPAPPPDLRAVPEPASAKVAGDPVAPAKKTAAKKTATPSPADVAKVAAKKTAAKKAPAKKTAAKKAPAKKTAKKDPGAPGDRLPARKKPQAAPKQEQNPESR